jgi:hypothetical protein
MSYATIARCVNDHEFQPRSPPACTGKATGPKAQRSPETTCGDRRRPGH